MLETQLPAARLQRVMDPVLALLEEAVLHYGPDGAVVQVTDSAKIATATIRLDSTVFTTDETDATTVAVSCAWLTRFLNIIDPATAPTFEISNPRQPLRITADKYVGRRELLDPAHIHVQELEGAPATRRASVTIPADSHPMELALQAAALCCSTITFDTTVEAFACHATGDNDEMTIEFSPADLLAGNETATKAAYPVDYLNEMFDAIPSDDRPVTMTFGPETPLRIHTSLLDGHGDLTFNLAPRDP